MKLAACLTPLETRRDVVLHLAVRAEQLGYDAFFLAEGWGHDAGVLLAEVAARTKRIRIGTGVLNVWGRSATGLAMLAATLNEASGDARKALDRWYAAGADMPVLTLPPNRPLEELDFVLTSLSCTPYNSGTPLRSAP